jgi:hypothetical protein
MTDTAPVLTRRTALWALVTGGALAATSTLTGCGSGKGGSRNLGAPPAGTLVMIIRHGEKPEDGSPLPGIDREGKKDDSSMTEVGWQRAYKLVDVFAPAGGRLKPGLAQPKAIYAAGSTDEGEGARTRETVLPLATKLGLKAKTDYGKGDEKKLVADVEGETGPTLICWQHGEIPKIAELFGEVTPTPPQEWPDERFDVIWTLTADGDGGWKFAQIPELVLPGDQPGVIEE